MIAQTDAIPEKLEKLVFNAAAGKIPAGHPFTEGAARHLIIAILKVCRICRMRNQENTIEVILFEYCRRNVRAREKT